MPPGYKEKLAGLEIELRDRCWLYLERWEIKFLFRDENPNQM